MPERTPEERLQLAARRRGLKMVLDRYAAAATGQQRYFLRPIWDATQAVRVLPNGNCELAKFPRGRRAAANLLLLDEVAEVLTRWTERKSCAPARLPWQMWVAEPWLRPVTKSADAHTPQLREPADALSLEINACLTAAPTAMVRCARQSR